MLIYEGCQILLETNWTENLIQIDSDHVKWTIITLDFAQRSDGM